MRVLTLAAFMVAGFTVGCSSATPSVSPTPTNEMQGAPLPTVTVPIEPTTTTTATTVFYVAPEPVVVETVTPGEDRWDRLAQCETGGNWSTNTGNGFGGGLQFAHSPGWSTWLSYGGGEYAPHPWEASRVQQIAVAELVLADAGWRAWPGCARMFGWL